LKQEVVWLVSNASGDLENVAKSGCGDQCSAGSPPLEKAVDRGGRAVEQVRNAVQINVKSVDGIKDAMGEITRCRVRLGHHEAPFIGPSDRVRKSTAYVNRDQH
jgi:hypothetical protein